MKTRSFIHLWLVALALSIFLVAARSARAPNVPFTPLDDAQWFSYSVARGGSAAAAGIHPADILGTGGVVLIPCTNLGLLCDDPISGMTDDITALAYGHDFESTGLPPVDFSVAAGSQGAAGTAVRVEAACAPAEPHGDVFEAALDGSNGQDLDGNGVSCGGNGGYGVALTEGPGADELDALDRDPCQFVDLNCDGLPENPMFLVLAPDSPTLAAVGATPADILLAGPDFQPEIWASAASLGLRSGDAIDALCLQASGDSNYAAGDKVLFSLAPGSPSLAALGASAADVLRPGLPATGYTAAMLGLSTADNLDAALCDQATAFAGLYFPNISRR